MLKAIRTTSLRTRLALLAAFAIVALLFALFVAWRLARATETFAVRQADVSVRAAASELARELQQHPEGYRTFADAAPNPPDKRGQLRVPPHVESLFGAYSDPFSRLTAITLHGFPDVAGGFCRSSDGTMLGFASQSDQNARTNLPADVVETIRSLSDQVAAAGAPESRTIQSGTDRIFVAVHPPAAAGLPAAWAMTRLSHLSGASDWPNLAALIALALSIIAVSGLALITVRDLRSGVTSIESGLANLKTDLSQQLAAPNTRELARIAAAINELAETLRTNIARQAELEQALRKSERLSALGRVVAGVAHEVRNPLSAIKLKVQLAKRSSYAPEKLSETYDVITAEIERLDSLVRRLLELGGHRTIERHPFDLSELVTARVSLFRDLATRASVNTTVNLNEHLVISGDRDRMGQVVDNIMQNALEAMPNGGELKIDCVRFGSSKGTARVTFTDTGRGIPPGDHENVFEPFYTGRDSGTGLGLAIARAIVEEHDGSIAFSSRQGSGTSFVIELPLYVPQTTNGSNSGG